jgi:hypothetical protein
MTDLQITRGDNEDIDLVVKNPDLTPTNLTGAQLWFYVKRTVADLDADALIRKDSAVGGDFDIPAPASGLATVKLVPADTESISADYLDVPLRWQIQVMDVGGNIRTMGSGWITIVSDLILTPGAGVPSNSPVNSFTYDVTTDSGKVRLLCQDFDIAEPIFSDAEIQAFLDLNAQDIRFAAAQALEVIAANEVYVQKRIHLLDLQTDGPREAEQLMKLAVKLREQAVSGTTDINDMFDWAEQVFDVFSAREVIYKEFLRSY